MWRAQEALNRLKEGNRRFVSDLESPSMSTMQVRREQLVSSQAPFAVILGCSDSRAPAEILFDQGLGDLFVIRVAGPIVAPSQVGSIEYAADQCGTRLVVVLGHTHCGAIGATLQQLSEPVADRSPNLRSIVDRIRPALQPVLDELGHGDPHCLMRAAVRANVRACTDQLRRGSRILKMLQRDDFLRIVGAEYDLETGLVTFLDDNVSGC